MPFVEQPDPQPKAEDTTHPDLSMAHSYLWLGSMDSEQGTDWKHRGVWNVVLPKGNEDLVRRARL